MPLHDSLSARAVAGNGRQMLEFFTMMRLSTPVSAQVSVFRYSALAFQPAGTSTEGSVLTKHVVLDGRPLSVRHGVVGQFPGLTHWMRFPTISPREQLAPLQYVVTVYD